MGDLADGRLSPKVVWGERRPLANRLPPSGRLFGHSLRAALLRVKYWSFYPVTNLRLTRLAVWALVWLYIVVKGASR